MGSNYLGDWGNERDAGLSSPSRRKGKKISSDKPKQPQRGLGVAQLEKIRLHTELGSTFLSPVHHSPYLVQDDMRLQTPHSSSLSSSSSFSYSSSSSPPYPFHGHHGVMMGFPDLDRASLAYGDSQPSNVARWHPDNAGYETHHFVEPSMTRPFFEPPVRGSLIKKDGSSSQTSESNISQEIDLELRL